jgi:hypothetical protein
MLTRDSFPVHPVKIKPRVSARNSLIFGMEEMIVTHSLTVSGIQAEEADLNHHFWSESIDALV